MVDLESRQKGKQTVGKQTDVQIALACLEDEIKAAQTSINDSIFALSMSTAVATDQSILNAIANDERRAEQDNQYAQGLDDRRRHEPKATGTRALSTMDEMISAEDNEDVISTVMGDLMERVTLDDKAVSVGEGSSRYYKPRAPALGVLCVSCLERVDSALFTGPCGHDFCRGCTRQMFLGAVKDEELYPPRCCGHTIPPGIAMRVLNYEELRAFSERAIEYSSKDRIYCADPTCSRFLPSFRIQGEHGTCRECHQQTHLPCRSLAHPGIDCPMDHALHEVLAMADSEDWRRCSNCRTMVELQHGCNHITCR